MRHVHFIGIGGAGMSGIARIMRARGFEVSGSDLKDGRALTSLRALGIDVFIGHAPQNVEGADEVVISSAIRADNVECQAAKSAGIPVIKRAEALAQLLQGSNSVAVAGTHGKTTTTSLLTVALQHLGVDPSFAIGGDLNESGANAHNGSGEHFIAEADESDGSFLLLSPTNAIVTNIELDHLDFYQSQEQVDQAFLDFAKAIPSDGFVVVCADDAGGQGQDGYGHRAHPGRRDIDPAGLCRGPDAGAQALLGQLPRVCGSSGRPGDGEGDHRQCEVPADGRLQRGRVVARAPRRGRPVSS